MKRIPKFYSEPQAVTDLSKRLVEQGETVLQAIWIEETQAAHVRSLLRFFDPPSNARILDVGCGLGGVADIMAVARPDLRFTLLNLSREQLALCPDRFEKVHGDAHGIPLPDACMDATMICYALGHMDIERALSECSRVTRPGGALFLYELTSEDSRLFIDVFDFEAYSTRRIMAAASQAGYVADWLLFPLKTHTEHFYDKMDRETASRVFAGIVPALFRFRKRSSGVNQSVRA